MVNLKLILNKNEIKARIGQIGSKSSLSSRESRNSEIRSSWSVNCRAVALRVKKLLYEGRTGESGSMRAAQLLTAGCAKTLLGDAVFAVSALGERTGTGWEEGLGRESRINLILPRELWMLLTEFTLDRSFQYDLVSWPTWVKKKTTQFFNFLGNFSWLRVISFAKVRGTFCFGTSV